MEKKLKKKKRDFLMSMFKMDSEQSHSRCGVLMYSPGDSPQFDILKFFSAINFLARAQRETKVYSFYIL